MLAFFKPESFEIIIKTEITIYEFESTRKTIKQIAKTYLNL